MKLELEKKGQVVLNLVRKFGSFFIRSNTFCSLELILGHLFCFSGISSFYVNLECQMKRQLHLLLVL